MSGAAFKPVRASQTTLTELMIPSYTNFGGKIHGGILLALMDKVAYVCASKHAGTYCVTASIDGVDFRAPVESGELVSLLASVNYVGRSSLVIGIRVESQNVNTGAVKHTNTSYFTMVAKDAQHRNVEVPGLILETADELRRFVEALRRRQLKDDYHEAFRQLKSNVDLSSELPMLREERCRLAIPGLNTENSLK